MNTVKKKKVIVITGAAQGLGYALASWFCKHLGDAAEVYLTGRTLHSAQEAANRLTHDGIHPVAAELNVANQESIDHFAKHLTQQGKQIDVLISNAAARIYPSKTNAEQVEEFILVNNLGTTAVLQQFTPLLADNAHVIVVASAFGSLRYLSPTLHSHFNVETASLTDIDTTMRHYAALVKTGKTRDESWPEWINPPSKIGQVATMKIYAREHQDEFKKRHIRVNAVCPGLMDTGASRPWFADMSTAQTPEEAAEDVAWLALLDYENPLPIGELIQHRRVIPWL